MGRMPTTALLGASASKFLVDGTSEGGLVLTPLRAKKELRGGIARNAIDDTIGGEAFEEVDERLHILVAVRKPKIAALPERRQRSVADDVQIMDFHGIDLKARHLFCRLQHLIPGFARKAEHQMGSHVQAAAVGTDNCVLKTGEVVGPAEPIERMLMNRLEAEFDGDPGVACKSRQGVEGLVAHAIRSRSDDQADHARVGERFPPQR